MDNHSTTRHFLAKLLTPLTACFLLSAPVAASAQNPKVLQVGSYKGKAGQYTTIQAAVNAAHPGDWILVAPGTYHEFGAPSAGVLVTTPGIHLRGMDRNAVVVDGTNPGHGTCSSKPAAQNFGSLGAGRNGIEVFQVDGVSIENLTACNFIADPSGNNGNQIWWNGGDSSGRIGMGPYSGAYLTASSTFYQTGNPQVAQYGIFVSNAKGPGAVTYSFASNMGDSGFYIGACADCNATLRFVHSQNNPMGFSGSNSGGHLVLEDSEWDHNQAGIVPSSLANDDPPSPQNGACPNNPATSCTIIQRNYVHDNNNPNTPANSLASTVPVGTGIDLSGSQNDTVQFNYIANNGSWGIMINDYPDPNLPAVPSWCQGGDPFFAPPPPYDQLYGPVIPCFFHAFGNKVAANALLGNGFFANPTNGDIANAVIDYPTNNCFQYNLDLATLKPSSSPINIQTAPVAGVCGKPWAPDPSQEAELILQLGCNSLGSAYCPGPPAPYYPRQTSVKLLPIPHEASMPNPCAGVPQNSWCPVK